MEEDSTRAITMYGYAQLHKAILDRPRDYAQFLVLYCDFERGLTEAEIQKFVEHRRDSATEDGQNTKRVTDRPITVQGHSGLEYVTQNSQGHWKQYTRAFFVNNRQFKLAVREADGHPFPEKDRQTFFDSFQASEERGK